MSSREDEERKRLRGTEATKRRGDVHNGVPITRRRNSEGVFRYLENDAPYSRGPPRRGG